MPRGPWQEEGDLLVVGASVCGLAAAIMAADRGCRTIVLDRGPFCLSTRLGDLAKAGAVSLRADFIYRTYDPVEVRRRWRLVRAGKAVPGGHAAGLQNENFSGCRESGHCQGGGQTRRFSRPGRRAENESGRFP